MNRLARLLLNLKAMDGGGSLPIAVDLQVDVAERAIDSPYLIAELLRTMLRDAADQVFMQARAIATNNAGRETH